MTGEPARVIGVSVDSTSCVQAIYPLLESFYRAINVGNILGIRLGMVTLKTCLYSH